jgi:hypothetical protein
MKISAQAQQENQKLINEMQQRWKEQQVMSDPTQTIEGLAAYVAEWINYELDKCPHGLIVDSHMIMDAMEAYRGGAR